MAEQSAHEPTMEEILASIRRIISEDDAPADEAAEPEAAAAEPEPAPELAPVMDEAEDEAPEEDVLELTEAYDAPSSVSIGDIDAYTPEAEPEPAPAPQPAPVAAAPRGPGGLVSETTETAALSSFTALTSSLLVPASDRTLEDVVRDMLKPMLQAWLDQNLPAIVEEQVRNEVERIARQSRR